MTKTDFTERLEKKVYQQLRSQSVGYLVGAGASFLDGRGYPLASELWPQISSKVPVVTGHPITLERVSIA